MKFINILPWISILKSKKIIRNLQYNQIAVSFQWTAAFLLFVVRVVDTRYLSKTHTSDKSQAQTRKTHPRLSLHRIIKIFYCENILYNYWKAKIFLPLAINSDNMYRKIYYIVCTWLWFDEFFIIIGNELNAVRLIFYQNHVIFPSRNKSW